MEDQPTKPPAFIVVFLIFGVATLAIFAAFGFEVAVLWNLVTITSTIVINSKK